MQFADYMTLRSLDAARSVVNAMRLWMDHLEQEISSPEVFGVTLEVRRAEYERCHKIKKGAEEYLEKWGG